MFNDSAGNRSHQSNELHEQVYERHPGASNRVYESTWKQEGGCTRPYDEAIVHVDVAAEHHI